jgi:SAM-dependent methyltransferase
MKTLAGITLSNVQDVYDGPEADLWELVMGEQIHIGGFMSSMELAQRAEIKPGSSGVDLCCCTGAGLRFLVRFCEVGKMIGVDASTKSIERGQQRSADEGLADKTAYVQSDACNTGLPSECADFVWGEDAWCYVVDKRQLVDEAARLVKSGGKIAYTDWVEGPAGLSDEEAARFMTFMKFPSFVTVGEYHQLLTTAGCNVLFAQDTGRFPGAMDLYLNMLGNQLTYDALKIIGFNMEMMGGMKGEMEFMQQLAHDGKIAQGVFVAEKN